MPRTRPDRMLADQAYSTQKVRDALRCRGIEATIPEPANQVAGCVVARAVGPRSSMRGSKPDPQSCRAPDRDNGIYKDRNTVERAINRQCGYRAVATR